MILFSLERPGGSSSSCDLTRADVAKLGPKPSLRWWRQKHCCAFLTPDCRAAKAGIYVLNMCLGQSRAELPMPDVDFFLDGQSLLNVTENKKQCIGGSSHCGLEG